MAEAFDEEAWLARLRELNPWAGGFDLPTAENIDPETRLYSSGAAFAAARRDACQERHANGIQAWNAWAAPMQELRDALAGAGRLGVEDEYDVRSFDGKPLLRHQAENGVTAALLALSAADFTAVGFQEATFAGARFPGAADFRGASFSGSADFQGASFSNLATFENAAFSHAADFRGASFSSSADFQSASFSDLATFESAAFSHAADFACVAFSDQACFKSATFCEEAVFRVAAFSGLADFERAAFLGRARFEGAVFSGSARFREAAFSSSADLWRVAFSDAADFTGATFSDGAAFGVVAFSGPTSFAGAAFSSWAEFAGSDFSGSTSFAGAAFSDRANFSEAAFAGPADFKRLTFAGPMSFDDARFGDDASFERARGEGPAGLSLANARFARAPSFIEAKFRRAPRLKNVAVENAERGRDVAARWRALKHLAAQAKDHARWRDFSANEALSRRWTVDKPFPFFWRTESGARRLSWPGGARFWYGFFYQIISDFGRSIMRPMLCWLVALVAFAGLYFAAHLFVAADEGAQAAEAPACLAGDGDPLREAFDLSLQKGLVVGGLADPRRGEQARACLFGLTGVEQPRTEASSSVIPYTPKIVVALGALQSVLSAAFIVMFLLTARNVLRTT